jgi:hypothetical protein
MKSIRFGFGISDVSDRVSFLKSARPPRCSLKGTVLHLREVATFAKKEIALAARISRLDEVNVLGQPLKTKLDTVTCQPWETKFLRLSLK